MGGKEVGENLWNAPGHIPFRRQGRVPQVDKPHASGSKFDQLQSNWVFQYHVQNYANT